MGSRFHNKSLSVLFFVLLLFLLPFFFGGGGHKMYCQETFNFGRCVYLFCPFPPPHNEGKHIGPIYMFSVRDPGKMFSKQVLGRRAFRLRALWNVLGTPSFRFKIDTHLGLRIMTYCVYTAQRCEVILTCTLRADSSLRAKPHPLRTCSRYTSVQTSFRRLTKGTICSENMVWPCSSWNCSSGNTTL